jgi:hypothetical protein
VSSMLIKKYKLLLLVSSVFFIAISLGGCNATSQSNNQSNQSLPSDEQRVAALQIVDCLLPGQLRRLGNTSYLTPRRPTKTTASDCNIRGGEYTAFDRADYKTALKIWMPAAQEGDSDAQVNVGEIFEKGIGGEPNYEAAIIWYERAAAQNNRRAQFNMGALYEQGLGVVKNKLTALNWYRQAWGMAADSVVYQSIADGEQSKLRDQLHAQITQQNNQLNLLKQQLKAISTQLETLQKAAKIPANNSEQESLYNQQKTQLTQLKQWIKTLEQEKQVSKQSIASLPKLRTVVSVNDDVLNKPFDKNRQSIWANDIDFGQYYALIIGNQDYQSITDLDTSVNDAKVMAEVLSQQYGFETKLLINADRITLMETINSLNDSLTDKDNLLIYYAGHGSRVKSSNNEVGYWLPVNAAAPPNDTFWVANQFISNHLSRIKAKRVLVIADSCYSGLLSNSPSYVFLQQSNVEKEWDYIKYKLPRRSRLLMTSGGDKPVLDSGGDGHSVFSRMLIDTLRGNKEVLSAPQLFSQIKPIIEARAKQNNFVQIPQYKTIREAGHEIGDFFFVPLYK